MTDFAITEENRVRRLPKRASYDRETIYQIIDEAPISHVAFVQDGRPFVIPMLHARMGDELVFHGATASRLLKHIKTGAPICVAFTLLDGLVLARSAFHHSVNYRSVVLYGTGRGLESPAEKLAALAAVTEHLTPGRWAEVRPPTAAELKATAVVALAIENATAKLRAGPPSDDEADYALPVWAGVLPLALQAGSAIPDERLAPGIPVPDYLVR
ncbi:MAG TPA: pyridoxamine 5'-phosphate oxidase family protein [Anaerolineae bacterium]